MCELSMYSSEMEKQQPLLLLFKHYSLSLVCLGSGWEIEEKQPHQAVTFRFALLDPSPPSLKLAGELQWAAHGLSTFFFVG